jgi:acyl carrier protein
MDKPWDDTFERILRQALPLLPPANPLRPDLNTAMFGLDSLAAVELLITVETAYGVSIPEERLELSSFATPGALWELLGSVRAADSSAAP